MGCCARRRQKNYKLYDRSLLVLRAMDIRRLFVRSLTFIYFIAFASSFSQWPGLHSDSGILPTSNQGKWTTSDDFMFSLHVLGMVISLALTFEIFLTSNLMFLLPMIYSVIIKTSRVTGAPFFNYQWDLLLIETGVIGCLWGVKTTGLRDQPPRSVAWALRFLAFKLMFSSGVVKILHGDPTWLNLKALNFHFASQPLPNPIAWLAHQSPDSLLRIGTAGSMWIEIPVALLILSPFEIPRSFAAFTTTLLMINILSNKQFFTK